MAEELQSGRFRGGRGLVLGKFLPPTRGHQLLIDFGRQHCSYLTVLVCSVDAEPIAGDLRYAWVRQMAPFKNVRVVHVHDNDLPQTPADHPHFWQIWGALIRQACPDGVDFFYASEDYGPRTAEAIGGGCRYVTVDRSRALVPVSGTLVRGDPMKYWDFLPDVVRPHFVKRVCVFGPESTGKSTLARDLAAAFDTVYASEYARPLLDPRGGQCRAEDIPYIARGQAAMEDALARQANRVLICDTDLLTTTIWSDVLFGDTPGWIRDLADQRTYHLYLLLDVDVPWVDDQQRFFKDEAIRCQMFQRFRAALDERRLPYEIIRGGWRERFDAAKAAVTRLIATGGAPDKR